MSLPRLKNNFELLVPDDDDLGEGPILSLSEQEAYDRNEELKRAQHEGELRALNRRCQAVQLGLPRPINVDMSALQQNVNLEVSDPELAHARELINAERLKLIHHDTVKYPLPRTTRSGALEFLYDLPDDEPREVLLQNPLNLNSCVAGCSHLLHTSHQFMTKEVNKPKKAEKLGVILNGHLQHAQVFSECMAKTLSEMQKALLDYSGELEDDSASIHEPCRVATLHREVERLERRESLCRCGMRNCSQRRRILK